MASYYPEGECFFRRSSLRYFDQFSADNFEQFYSHVLVEYQWNMWAASSDRVNTTYHARSKLNVGKAALWDTRFGVWDRVYVGETSERKFGNLLAKTGYGQSQNYNELRDLDDGGPRKYILRPFRIQSKNTKWLWIDATIPLRAIYFPLCQQSDEAFPDYCTYVVLDFRARGTIDISNLQGEFAPYKCTPESGLGYVNNITWGFNIPGLIAYLALPRQLRNPARGVYRSNPVGEELFVRADTYESWRCSGPEQAWDTFAREMDLAKIISATFGVEVGWRPYQYSSFICKMLTNLIEFGVGFIPGVGPLLSWGLGMGITLMEDPDAFSGLDILDLGEAILEGILSSSKGSKGNMANDIFPKSNSRAITPGSRSAEDKKAAREEGDRINAELTETIRNKTGMVLPESSIWLERLADDFKIAMEERTAKQEARAARQAVMAAQFSTNGQ